MLHTITIENHVQIQSLLVRTLDNGKVVVSVVDRGFEGKPVARHN